MIWSLSRFRMASELSGPLPDVHEVRIAIASSVETRSASTCDPPVSVELLSRDVAALRAVHNRFMLHTLLGDNVFGFPPGQFVRIEVTNGLIAAVDPAAKA